MIADFLLRPGAMGLVLIAISALTLLSLLTGQPQQFHRQMDSLPE